jgi:hypothetical protein
MKSTLATTRQHARLEARRYAASGVNQIVVLQYQDKICFGAYGGRCGEEGESWHIPGGKRVGSYVQMAVKEALFEAMKWFGHDSFELTVYMDNSKLD